MTSPTDVQCKRVIVLDTSAFVAGFDPFALGVEQVTVPKVEEEIRRNSMVKMRLEVAIESGKLKVKAPTQEFSGKAEASANKVGLSVGTGSFRLHHSNRNRRLLNPKCCNQNGHRFFVFGNFWNQTPFRMDSVLSRLS
jgi:hypothetical protein